MGRALELHCHEVTVRFLEKAVVPPYEGSMIRGAFGRAFKESCCPFLHARNGCPLGDKCPYGRIRLFEYERRLKEVEEFEERIEALEQAQPLNAGNRWRA